MLECLGHGDPDGEVAIAHLAEELLHEVYANEKRRSGWPQANVASLRDVAAADHFEDSSTLVSAFRRTGSQSTPVMATCAVVPVVVKPPSEIPAG